MFEAVFTILLSEQILGTPIYVEFSYHNQSNVPVWFSIGNGSADSYRFRADHGVEQLDPYYEFGGLAEITEVPPGRRGSKEILLNRYLHFLKPGPYTITSEIDLEITDAATNKGRLYRIRSQLPLNLIDNESRRREILASLTTDLTSQDSARQLRAIDALAELRSEEILTALELGLKSGTGAVVERAVVGLGNVGTSQARTILISFSESTAADPFRRLVQQELDRLGAQ